MAQDVESEEEHIDARESSGALRHLLLYGGLPVLVMAAAFPLLRASRLWFASAEPAANSPAQHGRLRVHGPMTVGTLTVIGDIHCHGPLTAARIERTQQFSPQTTEGEVRAGVVNGPLIATGAVVVRGNLEVHGPLVVFGTLTSTGSVSASGPIIEVSR